MKRVKTGAEIIQHYGLLPLDLALACYNGEIQAFTHLRQPILEETKFDEIKLTDIWQNSPGGFIPFRFDRYDYIDFRRKLNRELKKDYSLEQFNKEHDDAIKSFYFEQEEIDAWVNAERKQDMPQGTEQKTDSYKRAQGGSHERTDDRIMTEKYCHMIVGTHEKKGLNRF